MDQQNFGENTRIVSGMRTTGLLHLGHYYGVLKNWNALQYQHECFFFAADWHALTTHYEHPQDISKHTWDMIIDWLSTGLSPNECHMFIQSHVPEHAQLYLLLSMMTPLGWLERVPTYKDQQQRLKNLDLSTHGFLGYPLLQAADILIYKANYVPVGEDQVAHLELVREVARRFNYLYGQESNFEANLQTAIENLGKKTARAYRRLLKTYQEDGDSEALDTGRALIESQGHLTQADKERLLGALEGGDSKVLLPEPQPLLTDTAKFVGLDGQKMSKSYGNTIALREAPESVTQKLKVMPTDPARIRRLDPGTPEKCPVWTWHGVFSTEETKQWVHEGCRTAGIGCLDCKKALTQTVLDVQAPMRERAQTFIDNPGMVKDMIREGTKKARKVAKETLAEVNEVMGLTTHD